ncbi:MAG: dTMP kinase [Candidatus Marinimicrobia bacterium]|nr:dTMP kinase [Candidatus Neomarinimicrobiota bacterium]|tara:strand:- start:1009 stop:1632 length:624 start_codon:yes stop_codon:yes gene_type:complete
MNKLITFEGIDGSGKSTQINLLKTKFDKNNINNIVVREPGGNVVSEKIRNILLDNRNNINEYTEVLLFMSSRSQLVNEIIKPALKNNQFVLCDRYIDSTIAYQGYGRGINKKNIDILNDFAIQGVLPKLTLFFDLNINTALNRMSINKDRMEKSNLQFWKNVRNGYLELSKKYSQRFVVLDCNNKNQEQINIELLSVINSRFGDVLK